MKSVAVAILAAGMSTRLGRPKQTLQLAGQPVVAHVGKAAVASSADRVICVVGSAANETGEALDGIVPEIVINTNFAAGQGTSIATAVHYLANTADLLGACDAIVFVLGDQPGIATSAIDSVIEAWRLGAPVAIAQYSDRAGHPVLFDAAMWHELATLDADEGGKSLIDKHRDELVLVHADGCAPLDIDTESDWRRMQEMWPSHPD